MNDWILENPGLFRGGCFFVFLLMLALAEFLKPRRKKYGYVARRWINNFTLLGLDLVLLRVIFPLMAVEMGYISVGNGWGIFQYFEFSYVWNFILGIVVLDLIIYLQHVLFHAAPSLWRVHRVHHTDLDFDISTGIRFHPIEMILSMGIKICTVAAFGITPLSVLIFEVILNVSSMFTHTNLKLPLALDRVIRWVLVTPDMHRIHHSIEVNETNSNFGFNLSIWDRIFGTYKDQPKAGHEKMIIGIDQFHEPTYLKLKWLLAIPFIGKNSRYPIGRRK